MEKSLPETPYLLKRYSRVILTQTAHANTAYTRENGDSNHKEGTAHLRCTST
jgi:hypothetical protein